MKYGCGIVKSNIVAANNVQLTDFFSAALNISGKE